MSVREAKAEPLHKDTVSVNQPLLLEAKSTPVASSLLEAEQRKRQGDKPKRIAVTHAQTLGQEFLCYIPGASKSIWAIVLAVLWGAVVVAILVVVPVFLASSANLGFVFFLPGVFLACWAVYLVFDMGFRRLRRANIFIALNDSEFIYQDYDIAHRLRRVRIPRKAILRAYPHHGHLGALTLLYAFLLPEEIHEPDWQIGILYREENGGQQLLWIDYDELFPPERREELLRALNA